MSTENTIRTPAWVVRDAKEDFQLLEILLVAPQDDELVVEMKYSGICHTDIVCLQGAMPVLKYPAVLGHEGAGVIRGIGARVQDQTLKIGDLVLLSVNYCRTCKLCKSGHPVECVQDPSNGESIRSHFFGQSSFQRWSYVHETGAVKHPYPAEEAAKFAPMGCSFQTGAGTILNVLKPEPDSSLVVFGVGAVGMAAVMAAKSLGVRQIIAVDIQELKLTLAKDLGATDVLNPKTHSASLAEGLTEMTNGQGCDYAVDCTGVPTIIEQMLDCLAMRGTAVTLGVAPETASIRINPLRYLLGSKRYLGCQGGDSVPDQFIPHLVDMSRRGEFPVERIVKVYDYEELPRALHDLREGAVIKPVIQWF